MMKPIIFFGREIFINPIAFSIGKINVYWYGIIIVAGICLTLALLYKKLNGIKFVKFNVQSLKNKPNKGKIGSSSRLPKESGITFDTVIDYLVGAIIIGFICARMYYVLFRLDYYIKNLAEIFMIWNGGIAIYGGIIGAILYALYFCQKRNIKFLKLADLLVPYLLLVQSIGRWGNFVNREAYGYETNLPWKMGIYNSQLNDYIYVHPTFLYESILTFLGFIFLVNLSKNKKFDGQIFYLYMIIYGAIRFCVEGLRTDSLMFANFRISQLLSLIFVIFFGIIYYIKRKGRRNNEIGSWHLCLFTVKWI